MSPQILMKSWVFCISFLFHIITDWFQATSSPVFPWDFHGFPGRSSGVRVIFPPVNLAAQVQVPRAATHFLAFADGPGGPGGW